MANKRIDMLEIKQLIQLKSKGVSNREISRRLLIDRKTVNGYVKHFKSLDLGYEKLTGHTEAQLQDLLPATPSAKPNEQTYRQLKDLLPTLEKDSKAVGATMLSLWEHYKQICPDGYGYTQFKKYLNDWQKTTKVSMRMEHKLGDKLYVDYAGKKLEVVDKETGEVKEVEVFVAVLGASQYTYVEATYTQKQEDFINSLCHSLEFFKGVPQAIVPDNLRQAVDKSHKYEPTINKQLRAFACHYNTSVLPARAYRPQDKSLVEGGVKLAYQRIYFHLRGQLFFDLEPLNKAIKKLLQEKLNGVPLQNRDYSRRSMFEQQERTALQPLPESKYQVRYFHKALVQISYHIFFGKDRHYYSAPYQYVGKDVSIQYNSNLIELYYDHKRIAVHRRSRATGGYTTVDEHMPPNHKYVKGWSVEYFTNWAGQQHERVHYFVEQLFKNASHPEQAYKSCMGIQGLKRKYGLERLVKACRRAMVFGHYRYKVLDNILRKGIDMQAEIDFNGDDGKLPDHDNIRGEDYYE